MWIFTKFGMYSVTCPNQVAKTPTSAAGKRRPPQVLPEIDTETFQVRVRVREHLVNLQREFPSLAQYEIKETPNNDYRFRIYAPKAAMVEVIAQLVSDIRYGNFKNEVMRVDGPTAYERALHQVWSVMYGVQRLFSGPGIYDFQRPAKKLGGEEGQEHLPHSLPGDEDPRTEAERLDALADQVEGDGADGAAVGAAG